MTHGLREWIWTNRSTEKIQNNHWEVSDMKNPHNLAIVFCC